jgi:hypothetical protein
LPPVLLGYDKLPADGVLDVAQLEDSLPHLVGDLLLGLNQTRNSSKSQ